MWDSDLHIQIASCLGVREATIPLPDSPSAVTGPNASGKTSVATAVAGILARNPNPLGLGIAKSPYLHDGADYGEVTLRDEGGTELVRWVLGEKSVRVFAEAPDRIDVNTLAMTDFISPSRPSQRVELWEDILLPDPDSLIGELEQRLKQLLPRESQVHEILDHLRASGWVDTEKLYREHARAGKRDWSKITGETYGAKKGVHWHPTGWLAQYDGITVLDATSALEAARESLRVLQTHVAVSLADVERGEKARKELPEAERQYTDAQTLYEQAAHKTTEASSRVANIKARGQRLREQHDTHKRNKPKLSDTLPCPHPTCGLPIVVMEDGTLEVAESDEVLVKRMQLWQAGLESRGKELDALRLTAANLMKQEREAAKQQSIMEGKRNAAADRVRELRRDAKLGAEVSEDTPDDERISRAEQKVENAMKTLDLVRRNADAKAAHQSVVEYDSIGNVLGPRGVRASKLAEAVAHIHEHLQELAELTGWPAVELDKSYAVHMDSRPAVVSSGSERWRAQFLIQCAIAIQYKQPIVIADGADILDSHEFLHLVRACSYLHDKHGVNVLVCATFAPGMIPDDWMHTRLTKSKA